MKAKILRLATSLALLCLLGAVALGTSSCGVDTRYQRCKPDDNCGRDDQSRLLTCACDGICRATCKPGSTKPGEVCRDQERCVAGFCIHKDEPDAKLGESCDNPDGKGDCAKGVYECSAKNELICRTSTQSTTEVCDGKDNDCDGKIDNDLEKRCTNECGQGWSTCKDGKWTTCDAEDSRVCPSSTENCKDGIEYCREGKWLGKCEGEVKPSPEKCDGKDNDCDGQIDENLTRACTNNCGTGKETCLNGSFEGTCDATGIRVCGSSTGDCKQGVQLCANDTWTQECLKSVPPSPERCDNRDNDCDGKVDEDWPDKNTVCERGQGICRKVGVIRCNDAGTGTFCPVQPGTPQKEVCDGKDNDCDGIADNGLDKACTTICGAGVERCVAGTYLPCDATTARVCGASSYPPCKQGVEECKLGKWSGTCVGEVKPAKEECNGKDDDCDGQTDEDFATLDKSCQSSGVGACQTTGKFICKQDGSGVECDAKEGTPKKEVCNGKDDDCNGKTDDLPPVILTSHTSSVTGIAYHPVGSAFYSSSLDKTVKIWNRGASPPSVVQSLTHPQGVYDVAINQAGTILATACADGKVRLYNAASGALLRTLSGHAGIVTRVTFDRFGQVLASTGADKTAKLWNPTTGALLRTLSGHTGAIYGASFGSYSHVFATGGTDNSGKIWSMSRGDSFSYWSGAAAVNASTFGPLGLNLYAGFSDNQIRSYTIIDLDIFGFRYRQAISRHTLAGHTGAVVAVDSHTSGQFLLSGSVDKSIKLWDVQSPTGALINTYTGHTSTVRAVAFHPNQAEFLSGSDDHDIRLWSCLFELNKPKP